MHPLTITFFKICYKGDITAIQTFLDTNPDFDINTPDDEGMTAIANATINGLVHVIKFLHENKASLNIHNEQKERHFLYWVTLAPIANRREILEWLLKNERYLEIGRGVNVHHVRAALGIIPDDSEISFDLESSANDPNLQMTAEGEARMSANAFQALMPEDELGLSPAYYALSSGFEIIKYSSISNYELLRNRDRKLKQITNYINFFDKEEIVASLITARHFELIKDLYDNHLLDDLDYNKEVNFYSTTVKVTVAYMLAEYSATLFSYVYNRGCIPEDMVIDLNFKLNVPESVNHNTSIAYALANHEQDNAITLLSHLADRMIKKGLSVDLNNMPLHPSNSHAKYPLAQRLLIAPNVLQKLVDGLKDNEFVNQNIIPASETITEEHYPIGISIATTMPQLFKQMVLHQIKIPLPANLSREEKIRDGWILNFNYTDVENSSIFNGVTIAWTVSALDPDFFEELMLNHFPDEVINLDASPMGASIKHGQSIAWMLAANKKFKLLDTLVDRMKGHYTINLDTDSIDQSQPSGNIATLLAKHGQFELLAKIHALNPEVHVKLFSRDYKRSPGLAYYLLVNKQTKLLQQFTKNSFMIPLNERISVGEQKHIGVSMAWLLAEYDIELLAKIIYKFTSITYIDLTVHPQKVKGDSLEKILRVKDPNLLAFIKESNQRIKDQSTPTEAKPKKQTLGGMLKKEIGSEAATKTTVTEPIVEKTKMQLLEEKLNNLLKENGIAIEMGVAKNKKPQITFKGNAKDMEALYQKLKKHFSKYNALEKNFGGKSLVISGSEGLLNSYFDDNQVNSDLKSLTKTAPTDTSANTTANTSSTNKNNSNNASNRTDNTKDGKTEVKTEENKPVVLDLDQQAKWKEQLRYAFCSSEEVSIYWDEQKGAMMIKLPVKNKAWHIKGNKNQHFDDLGYIVPDEFITTNILKQLKRELQGNADMTIDWNKREVTIIPFVNAIYHLKDLQDKHAKHIGNVCQQVKIVKFNNESQTQQPANPQSSQSQQSQGQDANVAVLQPEDLLDANQVLVLMQEFFAQALKNISVAKKDTTDFSFLRLSSTTKKKAILSFSLKQVHDISVIDTITFMTTIADAFNRAQNDMMKIDVDADNNILIIMNKHKILKEIINPKTLFIVSEELSEKQVAEQNRRLQQVNQEPVAIRENKAKPHVALNFVKQSNEDIVTNLVSSVTSQVEIELKQALDAIKNAQKQKRQALMLKASDGIEVKQEDNDTDDIKALHYHMTELLSTQRPTGNIQANDEIYFHTYLLHSMQIMRLLASKVDHEEGVLWLMRNILRHSYNDLEWHDFYQSINNDLAVIIRSIASELELSKSNMTLFLPSEVQPANVQTQSLNSFDQFEVLLKKYETELQNKSLGKSVVKHGKHGVKFADRAAMHNFLRMVQESDFTYEKKRDCHMMMYAIIGEKTEEQPYRIACDTLGHTPVRDYQNTADTIYRDLILPHAQEQQRKLEEQQKQQQEGQRQQSSRSTKRSI